MFILILPLKSYGKDTKLWYHPHQGEEFELFLDTKKGYLVHREGEPKKWLVKRKHAELILPDDDDSVDDIV